MALAARGTRTVFIVVSADLVWPGARLVLETVAGAEVVGQFELSAAVPDVEGCATAVARTAPDLIVTAVPPRGCSLKQHASRLQQACLPPAPSSFSPTRSTQTRCCPGPQTATPPMVVPCSGGTSLR